VGQPQAAVFRRDFHPKRPDGRQALDHVIGDERVALDERSVHRRLAELPQPGAELLAAPGRFLTGARMWMDQVQPEIPEE
jgi:hypothetical protein